MNSLKQFCSTTILTFVLLLLLISQQGCAANKNNYYNFVTLDSKKNNNISVNSTDSTNLYYSKGNHSYKVPIDSIDYVYREREANIFLGAAFGGILGALLTPSFLKGDDLEKNSPESKSIILGGSAGFLLGAAVTLAMGKDKYYFMKEYDKDKKLETIEMLIKNSSTKQKK